MWRIIQLKKDLSNFPKYFSQVLENQIAALVIKNFWSKEQCALAMAGIRKHGLDFYEDVTPPIGKLGITQFENATGEGAKAKYFLAAQEANAVRQEVFRASGDPVADVIELLSHFSGTSIAEEEMDKERYFAGLVRNLTEALLHIDWARRDAVGWSIGNILRQASWNIVLNGPEAGTETIVYRRLWNRDDEALKIPNSYEYRADVVSGCEHMTVRAEVGDLFFFNSQNYHKVPAVPADKMWAAVSSFIGLTKKGDLVLWS